MTCTFISIFFNSFLFRSGKMIGNRRRKIYYAIVIFLGAAVVFKNRHLAVSEPFPRKVLIISSGRSGSSFLGALFRQHKEMFYLFEPMYFTLANPSAYESKAFKVLEDLYQCKFTEKLHLNLLLKGYRKKKIACLSGNTTTGQKCLSEVLKSSCLRSNTLVTKILTPRLPKGGLWGIRKILEANKNLRIVHLVREPRRVFASMKGVGWCKPFANCTRKICSTISGNIEHALNYYKDRYKLVVFYDMILNPSSFVVELYNFLGVGPVPEYIFSWIRQNTLGSKQAGKWAGRFTTSRNSTEVLHRKVYFSNSEEQIIDKHCGTLTKFINKIRKNSMT